KRQRHRHACTRHGHRIDHPSPDAGRRRRAANEPEEGAADHEKGKHAARSHPYEEQHLTWVVTTAKHSNSAAASSTAPNALRTTRRVGCPAGRSIPGASFIGCRSHIGTCTTLSPRPPSRFPPYRSM